MSYKISLALELDTKEERNLLLKDIRHLLMGQPFAVKGTVTVTKKQDVRGSTFMSLFDFDAEDRAPRPLETAIEAVTTDDAEAEPEPEGDETAVAVAEEEPEPTPLEEAIAEAEASEGDEPRTPFDEMLGRERADDDE